MIIIIIIIIIIIGNLTYVYFISSIVSLRALLHHKAYPKGYCCSDKAVICDWIKKTDNVSFASCILERDQNIKFSPFTPSGSKSQTTSTTPPAPSSDGTQPTRGTNNNAGNNASSTPAAANQIKQKKLGNNTNIVYYLYLRFFLL